MSFNYGSIGYLTGTNASATSQILPKEPEVDDLQKVYMPYQKQKQGFQQLSKGVYYMGYFGGFGELWARRQIWSYKRNGYRPSTWGQVVRPQEYQEKALDAGLADLKNCVVLSTTPTYYSQYQNACLLKSRGFELVNNSCYLHPGYSQPTSKLAAHPGIPDLYEHYEHIWYKVIGRPTEIGCPASRPSLNNCGVDGVVGLEGIQAHDGREGRKSYLAVAWVARGTAFPDGWKGFYSGEDYKLGHNFEARSGLGSRKHLTNAGPCLHKFDLSELKDWMPDFEKVAVS
jgi:hypothetical protein